MSFSKPPPDLIVDDDGAEAFGTDFSTGIPPTRRHTFREDSASRVRAPIPGHDVFVDWEVPYSGAQKYVVSRQVEAGQVCLEVHCTEGAVMMSASCGDHKETDQKVRRGRRVRMRMRLGNSCSLNCGLVPVGGRAATLKVTMYRKMEESEF